MAVYYTVCLDISDPSWIESYGPAVHELVAKHGGRYIAQDPAPTVVEGGGDAPSVAVIIEFPDRTAAEAWYNDPDYKPWLDARLAGASGPVLLLEGK